MAPEPEKLVSWLILHIATRGETGCPVSDLLAEARKLLAALPSQHIQADENNQPSNQPCDSDVDDVFAPTIWRWLTARSDVSVGPGRKWNHMSLNAILEMPVITPEPGTVGNSHPHDAPPMPRPNLFLSEDKTWEVVAGHGPDHKRLPRFEWVALLGVASSKENGILQTDLCRITGQDKRSIPRRTDQLAQKGYVEKRTILIRGSKTSKLWLKQFAPPEVQSISVSGGDCVVDEDMPSKDLASSLDPVPWHSKWTGTTVDLAALGRSLIAIVREWGIIRIGDLKSKLGIQGMRWQGKSFAKACRLLSTRGCLKYVAAQWDGRMFKTCVKYLRNLDKDDWAVLLATGQVKQASDGLLPKGRDVTTGNHVADQDLVRNDKFKTALETTLHAWSPDKPLQHSILDIIAMAGACGLASPQITNLTMSASFARYICSACTLMATEGLQPAHLAHFQLRREPGRIGRSSCYNYSAHPSLMGPTVFSDPDPLLMQGEPLRLPAASYGFSEPESGPDARVGPTILSRLVRGLVSDTDRKRKPFHEQPSSDAEQIDLHDKIHSDSSYHNVEESLLVSENIAPSSSVILTVEDSARDAASDDEPAARPKKKRRQGDGKTPSVEHQSFLSAVVTGELETTGPTHPGPQNDRSNRKSGFLCPKCGGSWKNSLGLQYHSTKAKTPCNPSYAPKVIPKPRLKVVSNRQQRPKDESREPSNIPRLGSVAQSNQPLISKGEEERSLQDDELDLMSDSRFGLLVATVIDIEVAVIATQEESSHPAAVSSLKPAPEIQLSVPEAEPPTLTDSSPKARIDRALTKTSSQQELLARINTIIMFLVDGLGGAFPGGVSIWTSFSLVWRHRFGPAVIPPTQAKFGSSIDKLMQKKILREEIHVFRSLRGPFVQCQLLLRMEAKISFPILRDMVAEVKKAYPDPYMPHSVLKLQAEMTHPGQTFLALAGRHSYVGNPEFLLAPFYQKPAERATKPERSPKPRRPIPRRQKKVYDTESSDSLDAGEVSLDESTSEGDPEISEGCNSYALRSEAEQIHYQRSRQLVFADSKNSKTASVRFVERVTADQDMKMQSKGVRSTFTSPEDPCVNLHNEISQPTPSDSPIEWPKDAQFTRATSNEIYEDQHCTPVAAAETRTKRRKLHHRSDPTTTAVEATVTRRALTPFPQELVKNTMIPVGNYEDEILATIIAVRALLGGVNGAIDWGLLLRLFPNTSLEDLVRVWRRNLATRARPIAVLAREFRRRFLVAYEQDELPLFDYDNVLSYDWPLLIRWTLELGVADETILPPDKADFDAGFLCDPIRSTKDDRHDAFFHPTASFFNRLEVSTACPATRPIDLDITTPNDDKDLAKTLIKALCGTDDAKHTSIHIKKRLGQLCQGDNAYRGALLRRAISDLKTSKAITRISSKGKHARPYRLSDYFQAQLGRLAQSQKYRDAAALKSRLDDRFRIKEKVRLPYTVSEGMAMALINLQARGRVRLIPVNVPHVPLGFHPGKYETRRFPKSDLRFGLEVVPTDDYVYTVDIAIVGACARQEPPLEGPRGETPIWRDLFGELDRERWSNLLGAFVFTVATRGVVSASHLCRALRPLLEVSEVTMMLRWAHQVSLLTQETRSDLVLLDEWWWLIVSV